MFGYWGVGSAERNDGVLVVVAINDRQLRIEVGRGLEATLTDIEAADIVRDLMVPKLKNHNYRGAVLAGEHGVRAALGDPTPNAKGNPANHFNGYGGGQPGSSAGPPGRPPIGGSIIFAIVTLAIGGVFLFFAFLLARYASRRLSNRFPVVMGASWEGNHWNDSAGVNSGGFSSGGGSSDSGGFSGGGGGGGGGFSGFGGGSSGGGGASGSW